MEPISAPFLLVKRGDVMDEVWTTIVTEALERGLRGAKGRPIPGAKLRQLVAQSASQHGVTYPPAGFEGSNFGYFLKAFDSILIVLRRPAQDLLVAPANRPELLMNVLSEGKRPQIREDLFDAFTRIPREGDTKAHWYDPTLDRFVWLEGTAAEANAALVPVPQATREQEIADRRSFADASVTAQGTRDSLVRALEEKGSSSLWAFSQALRSAGLSRKWHEYRFQLLTNRIREWSQAHEQPWREEWLVAGNESENRAAEIVVAVENASEKATLKELLSSLEEADLRRINVPLDLVLKLLRK
jgi:hypothetical protein